MQEGRWWSGLKNEGSVWTVTSSRDREESLEGD